MWHRFRRKIIFSSLFVYKDQVSQEKFCSRKIPSEKFPPGKFPPRKFPPGIFPPISLIAFRQIFTNVKIRKTKNWGLTELKILLGNEEERI